MPGEVDRRLSVDRNRVYGVRRRLREDGRLGPQVTLGMRAEQTLLADPNADPTALAREFGIPRHSIYAARARLRKAGAPGF